jgi:ankyrin repeat protein
MVMPDDAGRNAAADHAIAAIHAGDLAGLQRLLAAHPDLVNARVDGQRTLLHIATDWPGHFPNIAAAVQLLLQHGADVHARFIGSHTETPLHWAASCNDVNALDALLDGGADIDAAGGVIAAGTPLADAVAFGQWAAAMRLVERGARTTLWQAAALGLMSRVKAYFDGVDTPSQNAVTNAFWCACHGGQRAAAEYLLSRGADLNRVGHDKLTPLEAAERSGAAELVGWLRSVGATSARR